MKKQRKSSLPRSAAFLAACLTLNATSIAEEIPPAATLRCEPAPDGTIASIEIQAPGNQVWILQQSSRFGVWTDVDALKIHNGSFRREVSSDTNAGVRLFRAFHDPSRQDVSSTIETALILPAAPLNYAAPILPANFLRQPILGQDNTPAGNPVTDPGATLGRVLFYDKRLSANQTVSCASCHQREHGFSDPRRFSEGFEGGLTGRNSMGLTNARYYQRGHFFWDERADTLEDQVLEPIQNPVEMGMTLTDLETRLSIEPFYGALFTDAFGASTVTADRMARALAQFIRSIISTQSKYDAGVASGFSNFTAEENLGRRVFLGQVGNATCAACHGSDNFVPGNGINNNGLENPYLDKGLGAVTGRPQDEGLFKAPSLRNIELTAPYMHDGRFATLEEVVDFYDSGVVDHPNLSPPLRTRRGPGQPPAGVLRLNLSAAEKAALVAFLKTLTDRGITTDERFSDPFNYGD